MSSSGLFLTVEGGEGAGKSTQVRLLADWLAGAGFDTVVTHEPGATVIGAALRAVLLDRSSVGMSARTELLLYAADRAQHVQEVIRPALARGAVVVCDRFSDSTLAYQGAGRALPARDVAELCRWAADGLNPDLTVLLDLPAAVGLARRRGPADRLEAEPADFHDRVRAGFLALAEGSPARHLVLDATAPVDEVHHRIRAGVEPLLAERVTQAPVP
jgi:dTMP kinase